tara:strand:- start:1714 stop:3051 length:1338 start_codon:yes stop_codon:yes gene_type:complete
MTKQQETIYALSSTPGRSALSIIRVTGQDTFLIIEKITKNNIKEIKHQKSKPCYIYNINNDLIDKSVLTFYCSPNSYTGEDLVEITTHGNPIIVNNLFNTLKDFGARLANPGEFTSRAYHNNKIDLVQAESTLSVINAKSKAGVESSLRGVVGKLSNRLKKIKNQLVLLLSELEYELDISETDNNKTVVNTAVKNINTTIIEMEKLVKTYNKSSILNDGARVAIVGAPNVGKSTLLNALIDDERAIVTDIPGTTRDTIESLTYFSNYPVILLDTAGIRETKDKIENIGIGKTMKEILSADIIYNIQSSKKTNIKTDTKKTIKIYNKSDLMTKKEILELQTNKPSCVVVSAKDKSGLTELRSKTEEILKLKTTSTESLFLSSKRQQAALTTSIKHLKKALVKESLVEIEIIAHNLRLALNEFDWVLGKTTTDEILKNVFTNFCVGK